MWLLHLLIAASDPLPITPPLPTVPYETVGIVLVALVTGITGVIVALIQRGRNKAVVPVTVPPSPVFVISKEDWDRIRESVTRLEAQFEQFREDYDYHERWTNGEVRDLGEQIANLRGQMGAKT